MTETYGSISSLFELEDYFPNNRFHEKDKQTFNAIQKVFEGRDINSTLKKLFPEVIFQLLGPRKGTDGENSYYRLQMIVVPFKLREAGLGSQFMKELVKLAKQEQKDIFLTPDASYQEPDGMSKGQITQWYKTFGFKKKEKSDFRSQNTYCFYA